MPTTLITGGAGFIGSVLARQLADEGHDVLLADIKPLSEEGRFILGDKVAAVETVDLAVESRAATAELVREYRPDNIVHVAAVVNPTALVQDPFLALQINVEGTLNVLEAARQNEVSHLVLFSSIGVLPTVQYEPIDTSHPTIIATEGPGSAFYGASKLAAEAFALAYAASYGLDVRIVRPSAVYGLGMNWPIFIKPMVEGAVRGEPVELESGASFPRDYTHVADVASLVRAMLAAPPDADRVFYAATGESLVTAGALAEIVREAVPGAQISIADRLTDADRLELRYRGRISIDNARTQLGWAPKYAALSDGVRQYVDDYRAFLSAT